MQAEENHPTLSPRAKLLYTAVAIAALFILSLVIESCDTEKVEICDTTSGKCEFESTCRPLLVDIYQSIF